MKNSAGIFYILNWHIYTRNVNVNSGWMGGWLDGWMGGWVDGWMGGWVDG